MSPAFYAADRRSAALRSTDRSAPRTGAITAQMGNVERQTPIAAGKEFGATSSDHKIQIVLR